jgi:hypothetical protein
VLRPYRLDLKYFDEFPMNETLAHPLAVIISLGVRERSSCFSERCTVKTT